MADSSFILEHLPNLQALSAVSSNTVFRKQLSQASEPVVLAYLEIIYNIVTNRDLSRVFTKADKRFIQRRLTILRALSRNRAPLKSKRKRLGTLGLGFIRRLLPIAERYLVPGA
jgi:hypothetical protein